MTCVALVCFLSQMAAQQLTEAEVTAKMNLALEHVKADKHADALAAFLIVGENTRPQRSETERQVYVTSQTMACLCYEKLERHGEAYELAKSLLAGNLTEKERKDISRLFATNGYHHACSFIKTDKNGRNDYERARKILREITPYADERLKKYILPKIPMSYYLEGAKRTISQKYDEALPLYDNALKGFRELGETKNEISALKEMAHVKNQLENFAEAKSMYNQALTLARQTDDANVQMKILKEMLALGNKTGDMKLASSCSAAIDSLAEATTDAKIKFEFYNQKGDEARARGQHNIAEQWYLKGMKLAEQEGSGVTRQSRHTSYMKLHNLYTTINRYDDAITFGHKANAEFRRVYKKSNGQYFTYITMAMIYNKKGDKANCYACLDSMSLDLPNITEPREASLLYQVRASCHSSFSDNSSALADYKKADETLATKYPPSDISRIKLMAQTAAMQLKIGHNAEAEEQYKLYAKYTKQAYGENSMEYIRALTSLANAEGFNGNAEAGCRDYALAASRLKLLMKERIPYISSEEREGFWEPISTLFSHMTPFALQAGHRQTAFTKSCYDALVMSKAFLLESERSLAEIVKKEGTEEDMRDYMELTLTKKRLKEMEKNHKQFADSILALSQRADMLATRLSERCRGYGSVTEFMDVDHEAVRKILGANDFLIDFTDFVSKSEGRKYAAYIINSNDECPRLKPLFAERQIDSLGITRPDMYYDKDYAPEVLRLLWEPLEKLVPKGSTVYYVPSQLLFQVSLESLPLADGSLLGSHYNFVRLSSARELVRAKKQSLSATPQTAVLYGGLQYDLQPTAMIEEARKYELPDLLAKRGGTVRGDSIFRHLPGSLEEVTRIAAMLKTGKWRVTSRTGMEGTEESFLSMHGKSPQLLHVATHGFYYTPAGASEIDYLKDYSDAMLLSGIVLSGANAAWTGRQVPDGVLGGILTASDIARLDLSGTEMAVLSACQSGQGRATSEGLYGLQRAFKKAGVGTIVMSLWNVSDKVTTDFMVAFYEQLTATKAADKRKAFENAKAAMRAKYPDPFHWAAFVMLD